MKRVIVSCLMLVAMLLSCIEVRAWSSAGHMVIAAEAYKELSTELQSKVSEMLKAHPDYAKWEKAHQKESSSGISLGQYVFMRASTWPDEIRRDDRGDVHAHWHYVNYPLIGPAFAFQPGPATNDDVVFGIGQNEKILGEAGASKEARAVALSWLIHLVGDIHQPLHCAVLINETYHLPAGDKGGNDFYVKPADEGIRLHSFWDGLLGRSFDLRVQMNYATQIQTEHPRKSLAELVKGKRPMDWSLESRGLALEKGYLRGKLRGSKDVENAPALPGDYAKNAKAVAERRGALAGYRLADEIKSCVK
jgi:S1/P1 Nuclease